MRNASPVRAVVADSGGVSPAELCRQLLAAGLDPSTSLDAYRDGVPIFGVRTLREGVDLALGFDDVSLRIDEETNMADIPNLKQSAAPMPRTNKPAHVTPGSTETGADSDSEIGELIERLFQHCVAHDLPTDQLQHALEPLLVQTAGGNGDAGVPSQHIGAEDDEPLDSEMVEKIMRHLDGRLSPAALGQLRDMLEGGPDEYDWMPPGLRDKASRDQLERQVEHLDPHSASDALENIRAIELMRERGNLERGTGERLAERRGTEAWHPGKGEPPGTGLPHPGGAVREPGSLVPRTSRPFTAGDAAIARVKTKPFHKLIGVKRKHLPRVI
jgi:hypothetical protein